MQTGIGRHYREPSWLERLASAAAVRRAPAWLRTPFKRTYNALLAALPGGHLTCRLPAGETLRVDPAYRHMAWNPDEYAAFKACAREGATVLDIGANVGSYTLLFAKWVGDTGHVYAFEPASASRAGLERHVSLNALSDRVTIRSEAISDQAALAAFIDTGTQGDNRIVPDATSATIEVPALSVDEFCEASGVTPDIIKIDVEGAELAALRGARRTIAKSGGQLAMFVELHPAIWPSLGFTRAQIEEELSRQGLIVEPLPGVADPWGVEGVCVRLRRP
jgi:FkbM family methyltransferase